jgi:hypothetical protein
VNLGQFWCAVAHVSYAGLRCTTGQSDSLRIAIAILVVIRIPSSPICRVCVDYSVAVVVDFVTDFRGAWVDHGVGIVAVIADRVAVGVHVLRATCLKGKS